LKKNDVFARKRSWRAARAAMMALVLCAGARAETALDNKGWGSPPTGAAPVKALPMEEAIDQLAARLQREPDDLDGWVLLGRSYHFVQRYDEAERAFARAEALGYQREMPAVVEPAAAPATRPVPSRSRVEAVDTDLMRDIAGTLEKARGETGKSVVSPAGIDVRDGTP
jgi:predicted Zn-dependent protease